MITRKDGMNALSLNGLFSDFGKDNLMKNGQTHRHVDSSVESSGGGLPTLIPLMIPEIPP